MTVKQKIIVCGLAALFILILMTGWGCFAYHGKTDVPAFIGQLGTLITVAVGLITAFAGHQAAQKGAQVISATESFLGALQTGTLSPAVTSPAVTAEVVAPVPPSQ